MDSTNYFLSSDNNCFKDKHIIITGATGGIGSILTETLYNLGASLLLISHNEEKLKSKFHTLLFSRPQNIISHQPLYEIIDLENPKQITLQFPSIMKKLKGRLDILIMCHGKYSISLIKTCSVLQFDTMMNINVRSVFHLLSLSTPFLKITKGNVVIVSSLESKVQSKFGPLNTITKSMINSLVQCSALELSSFGIRINAVAPGITNTLHRLSQKFKESDNEEFMKTSGHLFLLNKKVLQPDNIVDTILLLASEDAGFITGEIIVNDNGYSLNHDLSYNDDVYS